jgi:hypothetical protein
MLNLKVFKSNPVVRGSVGHESCPPMFTRAAHSAGILLTIHCAMYAARRRHLKHAFSFLKQSPWHVMVSRVLVWSLFFWTSRSYGATAPRGK